ncbi:hypothetical protein M1349_02175 [Patescibacteria group bacterium]|nr:hypothetical protein [Patescibacteria group bacterium]
MAIFASIAINSLEAILSVSPAGLTLDQLKSDAKDASRTLTTEVKDLRLDAIHTRNAAEARYKAAIEAAKRALDAELATAKAIDNEATEKSAKLKKINAGLAALGINPATI